MTAPTLRSPARLPQPPGHPVIGHLWPWTFAPVPLLAAGARTGEVFRLRLWRSTLVGYRPEWNRAVLGDLDTFRSRGSLSGLTPYLADGVVHTDLPAHAPHRRALNPHFHSQAVRQLTDRLRAAVQSGLPGRYFDALPWAGSVVRRMLSAALFGDRIPQSLLERFLAPLHRPNPAPLLPRPRLFRRMNTAIAAVVADPVPGTLAAAVAGEAAAGGDLDPVAELRVALAAGYDTTAHTLAWTLWWLAGSPAWRDPESLPMVLDEILRLYPAGWLGSRVAARDTEVCGVAIPAGTMVCYSPYLTHRDPGLWPEPDQFRPDRFTAGRPAWGFIPFAAGRRTCLGAQLARAMLTCASEPFLAGPLRQLNGDPSVVAGITLRPHGPLWLSWRGE
ncbi:cytochrome P450 [Natronosporangium hydrolyticum]|uniref:Cytochrome P450 n=1 Tax=Natronosporangium hydrolyticum TaxID=2811111 RepID=A0A895YGY9_9ACTN|nr:cytochrome P450 [Natronosporangium hydrolyticum]QSB13796.1 cytochrome P450 [Natronosporangium hydrolyticum]